MRTLVRRGWAVICLAVMLWAMPSIGADRLVWRTNQVDAEIQSWDLETLLEKLSIATGWEVFVEPGTSGEISTKFKNLSADEALRRLLGKVSYARSQTNGMTRLVVFKSTAGAATQMIAKKSGKSKDYLIPNELIVKLKKDSKRTIEEIAARVKGKIVGRFDRVKLYRLQFADAAAVDAARKFLATLEDDVLAVESNHAIEAPTPDKLEPSRFSAEKSLLNPPKTPTGKGALVGLIDTAIQDEPRLKDFVVVSDGNGKGSGGNAPYHATGMAETILDGEGEHASKILAINVYGDGTQTSSFEVIEGIVKAINAGANPINLSLGSTGDNPMLHKVIEEGAAKGIIFIAAAGNEPGKQLTFPAAYPEVISVTAVDNNGQLEPYANSGDFVDMATLGRSIISYNGQMWEIQGTSAATARATGMLAALYNQTGSWEEALKRFKASPLVSAWQTERGQAANRRP